MTKFIWQKTYQIFVLPFLFVFAHFLALFSRDIREGLFPRRKFLSELKMWIKVKDQTGNIVLFHAASMGEFEHIKPLLYKIKTKYQTTNILTFFSPSGYKNVKDVPGLDFFLYMPFDFASHWKKLFSLINPKVLIISKHDVWPNQIWQAKKLDIPLYLVNASLPEKSSRTKPWIKNFQKHIYRDFSQIFTISNDDAQRFSMYYPKCIVKVIGDTKYDQVMLRKKANQENKLLPEFWYKDKWNFVAGSIWPEDKKCIIPGLINALSNFSKFNLIIAPHEINERFIQKIENELKRWGTIRFSQITNKFEQRVIIIDTIGQLADIYKYAKAAYVGGSFKQGIHNVMEPGIYGIPVIFGPVHENSYEAIQLVKNKGGLCVNNESSFIGVLDNLIKDKKYLNKTGKNALKIAQKNLGATDKILKKLEDIFK